MPVTLVVGESLPRAIAAYQEYDVLLVNPVADGLNLVAKEGVIVNEREGVLVLSEPAGVYEEIGAFCIGVNPFDVLDQANALDRALRMPDDERRSRAAACREVVVRNDLDRWLGEQLRDLVRIMELHDVPQAPAPRSGAELSGRFPRIA
jgi:trehalose 6-phosphate synthase